jgi:hypothetical protein
MRSEKHDVIVAWRILPSQGSGIWLSAVPDVAKLFLSLKRSRQTSSLTFNTGPSAT